MKIEIWCEGVSLYGEQATDIITVRVPPDIKIIDSKACLEMLERRRERLKKINRYRVDFNTKLKNSVERDIFGKKNLVDKLHTVYIKNWTPIITREALEFICDRL